MKYPSSFFCRLCLSLSLALPHGSTKQALVTCSHPRAGSWGRRGWVTVPGTRGFDLRPSGTSTHALVTVFCWLSTLSHVKKVTLPTQSVCGVFYAHLTAGSLFLTPLSFRCPHWTASDKEIMDSNKEYTWGWILGEENVSLAPQLFNSIKTGSG